MIKRLNKKGGFEITTAQLIGILLALFILAVFGISYFFGYEWLMSALEKVRNVLRFGG